MKARFAWAAALLALPMSAPAQEAGNSILVLDASGSMWGQIDGITKIEIAQGVVGDLLQTLPESQAIGLTAYGHRTKGDCTDIETLVAPGSSSRAAIADAVNALKPRGKTPMTDAVKQAAEALKYTEDAATVILVSDGIETCNPDPCAAARALEESGAALTVHVVGFDVSDAEARRQMQCLAEETGGQFLLASNASELGNALQEVTQAAPAYPVTFVATAGEGGPQIEQPLMWNLSRGDESIVDFQRGAGLEQPLIDGTYTVSALRPEDEASAETDFIVTGAAQTVTLAMPTQATISGPESAVAGATVPVEWSGPDGKGDYISVSVPDERGYATYTYTRDGSPLQLKMPAQPGSYELRYIRSDGNAVLATRPITVTEVTASLDTAETAPAGATLPVTWDGPDYKGDYIDIAAVGETGYVNYVYTRNGTPGELVMPPEPGSYVIRYVMAQDRRVLASRPVEVTAVDATLDAAATGKAGAVLDVGWTGPDYKGDYIAISKPGESGYEAYAYTRSGSPAEVLMPAEPGSYELRYVMAQDRTVLATRAVEVLAVSASLEIPQEARAGAPILVHWDGPGYQPDYVSVSRPDDQGYEAYAYTRTGSPVILQMPETPGEYEIRYIAASDGKTVLARETITLTEVTATLDAPETGQRGGTLGVHWEGPDFQRDYISIAVAGDPDNKYVTYAHTSKDSPLVLELPDQPGAYELRYVMDQGKRVLARKDLVVE